MRALTGYPLWFGLIAAGLKPNENRPRQIIPGGAVGRPFAIHHGAAKSASHDDKALRWIRRMAPELFVGWDPFGDPAIWPAWYQLGRVTRAVTAVATVERRAIVRDDALFDLDTAERICALAERRFATGPVVYLLGEVRRLPTPVPCPGGFHRGFWTLPDDVACQVHAQLAAGEQPRRGSL